MALDPTSDDPSDDPYVAWARSRPQQQMSEYPLISDLLGGKDRSPSPQPGQAPSPNPLGRTGEKPPAGDVFDPRIPRSKQPDKKRDSRRFGVAGDEAIDEAPAAAHLSPEDEAQIQIDQPDAGLAAAPMPVDAYLAAMQGPPGMTPQTLTPPGGRVEDQGGAPGGIPAVTSPAADASADAYARFASPLTVDQQLAQEGVGEAHLPTAEERAGELATMTPEDKARAVSKMTPDEYVKYKTDRQGAMMAKAAADERAANLESMQRAQRDMALQQQAVAKADADTKDMMAQAQRIANTKVDPNRFRNSSGISGWIGAMLGGAASQFTGGRNLGLEQFNKAIDNDIAAQKDDIANQWQGVGARRGAIASEYERHGDLYKAQETYRLAQYQGAINDMQTQLQLYDPAGSTAIRGHDALGQLHAQQQQGLMAFNAYQQKQHFDAMKATSDYAEKMATVEKLRLESMKLKGQIGAAGTTEKIAPPEAFEALGLKRPPAPMTPTAYRDWLGLMKQSGEATNAGLESQQKTAANEMQAQGMVIRNPVTGAPMTADGTANTKPITAGNVEETAKANEALTKTQNFIDSLATVRNALDSDPSTFDRKKWAEINAAMEVAKTDMMQYWGAKVSSREKQVADEVIGGDFSGYLSRVKDKGPAVAALDAIIRSTKQASITTIKGKYGYTGPSPFLDVSNPAKPTETSIDRAIKTLSLVVPEGRGAAFTPGAYMAQALGKAPPPISEAEKATGMFEEHAEAFETLKKALDEGTPAEKKRALGALKQAVEEGPDSGIRDRASRMLLDHTMSTIQSPSDEAEGAAR